MTFNIRYAHTQPPDLWPDRLPVIREIIERRRLDVIGTQEGLYPQLRDLENSLPNYGWIGTGRDGGSRGEFMAVFYRKDRLEPLEYDHYWLSDTPAIAGSRTWGNNYPRMVTWVRFRDRVNGGEFIFVNTHLDHEVQQSRERSAALILERLASVMPVLPVILVGDFNVGAGDNQVYSLLTGSGRFTDSWVAAGNADTLGTFHEFKGVPAAIRQRRIDWILLRGPAAVVSSEIVTDARGGQLPSDHFPVVARISLDCPCSH
jgi:endonuclease/exonuclease/phosphatase family metal-dependent hydrolase